MFMRLVLLGLVWVSPVFGQFSYPKQFPPSAKRRTLVLQVVSTGRTSGKIEWTEETLAEVIYWYDKGDHRVLSALLDSSAHCDGATSELLGSWLGETFISHPMLILKAVTGRSNESKKRLGFHTVSGDGSGQEPWKMVQIRKLLTRYSRSTESKIAQTAALWLEVLNQFEADQKESQ